MAQARKSTSPQPTPEAVFGLVVRSRRIELDLSQEDLGGVEGIDRSFISRIESGKRQACFKTILHLAGKLGWTPAELVDQVCQRLAAGTDPNKP